MMMMNSNNTTIPNKRNGSNYSNNNKCNKRDKLCKMKINQ